MHATVMYAAGDVRIDDVADPSIVDSTDATLRVTSACATTLRLVLREEGR